jgi:hypothetical protein
MKVEVTHADISSEMGIVATVELVDEAAVKVDIRQVVGWNDWLDLSDAVRRAMFLMEVKND